MKWPDVLVVYDDAGVTHKPVMREAHFTAMCDEFDALDRLSERTDAESFINGIQPARRWSQSQLVRGVNVTCVRCLGL